MTITGATGLIGRRLVSELQEQGTHVRVLSRDPARAAESFRRAGAEPVEVLRWDPLSERAPAQALAGADAVVHLAGEPVAQRWSTRAKEAIRESRVSGTRNLVAGLEDCDPRPPMLLSGSAIGYYGPHGEEPLDEDAPAGQDFLAQVCADWEAEASKASQLGMRVALLRTGVVLDPGGGALAKMLPAFRLGVGGAAAGGRQYISWIHRDDLVGIIRAALADERWSGPVNGTAPEPCSNSEFSRELGRALHRPSLLPVPGAALRVLYGDMAEIVTSGARVVPAKALVLGYRFRHPELAGALRSALQRS